MTVRSRHSAESRGPFMNVTGPLARPLCFVILELSPIRHTYFRSRAVFFVLFCCAYFWCVYPDFRTAYSGKESLNAAMVQRLFSRFAFISLFCELSVFVFVCIPCALILLTCLALVVNLHNADPSRVFGIVPRAAEPRVPLRPPLQAVLLLLLLLEMLLRWRRGGRGAKEGRWAMGELRTHQVLRPYDATESHVDDDRKGLFRCVPPESNQQQIAIRDFWVESNRMQYGSVIS